jgi:hypothetical protein
MTRDQFTTWQSRILDQLFSLTDNEEAARACFERLALDTYDCLTLAGDPAAWLSIGPQSAAGILAKKSPSELPEALRHRWEDWKSQYDKLRARNPRLDLRDLMHEISESHDRSSWPYSLEDAIQDWIDADDPKTPPPFCDRDNIVTPEFYQRLRSVRPLVGGWLYWSDDRKRVVFAPEAEWQQLRAARAEARRQAAEARASAQRKLLRLQEIVAVAREDAAFWDAAKARMMEDRSSGKMP